MIEAALILGLPGIIIASGVVFQMIRNNDRRLTHTLGASLATRWFSALGPNNKLGAKALPPPLDLEDERDDRPDGA